MVYGFDDAQYTTLGTAVAETQINAGASLRVPSTAKGIVEIVPYFSSNGASTTDQSYFTAMRISSDDVAVEPKRFVLPIVNGGDASLTSVLSPALKAYPMNINLQGFERINYFGQSQVANTVALGLGATVVYSEAGVGTEQFYQKPDNESVGGTTADTRTGGNTITVTGGGQINSLYAVVAGGAVTASQADIGFMEFQSSDFQTAMPYRVAIQPSSCGLGANANQLTGGTGLAQFNVPSGIPMDDNCTINTFYTNRVVKTGASNFIGCVRYTR